MLHPTLNLFSSTMSWLKHPVILLYHSPKYPLGVKSETSSSIYTCIIVCFRLTKDDNVHPECSSWSAFRLYKRRYNRGLFSNLHGETNQKEDEKLLFKLLFHLCSYHDFLFFCEIWLERRMDFVKVPFDSFLTLFIICNQSDRTFVVWCKLFPFHLSNH